MQRKPIICLDFDGVIHDYREGWKDGSIYGDVTPGFFDWATRAKERFKLVVYSSRSKDAAQLEDMKRWIEAKIVAWHREPGADRIIDSGMGLHFRIELSDFEFSGVKPPAFLTIDDRCVRFEGRWDGLDMDPQVLATYRTWSQK